jgi:hypothetical protein
MARALLVVAAVPHAAQRQARRGREYVCQEWSRERAFRELQRSLMAAASVGSAQVTEGEASARSARA